MTAPWHAGTELLERYTAAVVDDASAASLEAHLMACSYCREALGRTSHASSGGSLERVWEGVQDRLDPVRRGVIERLLTRSGVPEHTTRVLAATRSLRLSWFAAMAAALGFAILAAYGGTAGLLVFLIVAPLVPLAGVAAAYGPGMDPAYEIGVAAPIRSFRLMLIRATAVLVASLALAGIAALALPQLNWSAAAWLLPSLGLTMASLALSTYVGPIRAAMGITSGWILTVLATEFVSSERLAAFHRTGQLAFLVIAVGAAMVLAGRRQSLERRRT